MTLCKYSMSQLDCVVYHTNSVMKGKIVVLTTEFESSNEERLNSNIDVNIEDTDYRGIELTQSVGCAVEVKVDPNNCYQEYIIEKRVSNFHIPYQK